MRAGQFVFLSALVGMVLMSAPAKLSAQAAPSEEYLAAHPDEFLVGAIKALKWEEPFEPVHVVGPIYYIGTVGLGAYLVTTSQGHVIVNTGMPSSGRMMLDGIAALGFKPEDVRIMLSVHAHTDHAGAIAELKEVTGAEFAMMEGMSQPWRMAEKATSTMEATRAFTSRPQRWTASCATAT